MDIYSYSHEKSALSGSGCRIRGLIIMGAAAEGSQDSCEYGSIRKSTKPAYGRLGRRMSYLAQRP